MNDGPFYVVKQKRIEHLALTDIVRGDFAVRAGWVCWGDFSPQKRGDIVRGQGLQLVAVQVLEDPDDTWWAHGAAPPR